MRLFFLSLFLFFIAISNNQATAKSFNIKTGLPISYIFSKASDGENINTRGLPKGIIIGSTLSDKYEILLEFYEIPFSDTNNLKLKNQLIDFLYNYKIESLSFGFGLGFGNAEIKGDNQGDYLPANIYQYLCRFTLPLNNSLNISAGFNQIYSTIKFKETDYYLQTGGIMSSIVFSYKY